MTDKIYIYFRTEFIFSSVLYDSQINAVCIANIDMNIYILFHVIR